MLFQPRIRRSPYLEQPPAFGDRLLEVARTVIARIDWRGAFRGAGPRVIVGLGIWCAGFAGIHYLMASPSLAFAHSTAAAQMVPSPPTSPAPLSSAPALTLVSDAATVPAPTASATPAPAAQTVAAATSTPGTIYMAPAGTYPNNYDWGQCTWYVAGRRRVPSSWGNADTWYPRAEADGWSVGTTPVVGAIAWTDAGYYGHVALVEQVLNNGNTVVISEMNYYGVDIHDTRTLSSADFHYIYQ